MHFLFRIAIDGARFVATNHLKIELGLLCRVLVTLCRYNFSDGGGANETNLEARVRVRVRKRKRDGVQEKERE